MKHLLILIFLSTSLLAQSDIAVTAKGDTVLLFKDHTYKYKKEIKKKNSVLDNKITEIGKKLGASSRDIKEAQALAEQGWEYTLPSPKSNQAYWGNSDGRTTWWYGYWKNIKTREYSSEKPLKKSSGYYKGNGQNNSGSYRRGGSPRYPTKLEKILSEI